jgi:hypothetical protein
MLIWEIPTMDKPDKPEGEPKGLLATVFAFVEKTLSNYSLLLWLVICALGLLLAWRIGWLTDEVKAAVVPQTIGVSAWLFFCLLMNAVGVQKQIWPFLKDSYNFVANRTWRRPSKRLVRKTFRKIMLEDCAERDWFVWYLYVQQDWVTFKNRRGDPYRLEFPPGSWTGWLGSSLISEHKMFVQRKDSPLGKFLPTGSSTSFFFFETIDFMKELVRLADEHPTLKDDLKKVRGEVGDQREFRSKKKLLLWPESRPYYLAI